MRDRDTAAVVLAFALAGCPLATSTTTTTTLTASRPVSASDAVATAPSTPATGAASTTGAGGTPRATVPNLIGKTPEQARALVKTAGFAGEPEATRPLECEGAPREPGLINCQDPEPGQVVERYRMITISVYREQVIAGAIVRRQLAALHGLTPDQARQQLKKLGHDGKVTIDEVTDSGGGHTYVKQCGQNKVCYTSGESGIGLHDDLTLFINPTLKIAPPP
jgi:hypothetical protein